MRRYWLKDAFYIFNSRVMRNDPYRRKGSGRKLLFLLIFISVLYLSFSTFENKIKPTVMALAEARAKVIATQAINQSVNEEIVPRIKYEDLVSLKKDEQGRITAVQTNTVKMNEIQALVSQEFQDKIANIDRSDLKIPIGNIFNSSILAGWGPKFTIRIIPVGTVQSNFSDDFTTAGINQTKHKIWLEIKGKIAIIVPLISTSTEIDTSIPIAETIIVGNVPQTYLDVTGASDEEKEKAKAIAPNMATMGK